MNVDVPTGQARTPLTIGWQAAKANAVPGFILQVAMLAVLLAYYFNQPFADFLNAAAAFKGRNPILSIVGAGILAGAILPELFVVYFFQKGRWQRQNLRNLMFTVPTWAIDAVLVNLMYRLNMIWFGDVVTVPVVLAKIWSTNSVTIHFLPRRPRCLSTNGKMKAFLSPRCVDR